VRWVIHTKQGAKTKIAQTENPFTLRAEGWARDAGGMTEWTPFNALAAIAAFVAGQFALYLLYRSDRQSWIAHRKESAQMEKEDAIARARHP